MGDVQYCDKLDLYCFKDGKYQFNIDVVFELDGILIVKYYKQYFFYEKQFNILQKVEIVVFNILFGVIFGVFICFDMLFYDLVIIFVEKYGVRNIVFLIVWMDGFFILVLVEFQ